MIRLAKPDLCPADMAAVMAVMESGQLSQGKVVVEFEKAFADYVGLPFAAAVNSGTSALHLALLAVGVGPGDTVAVPAFSFPAVGNVVELCGATPCFVDVTHETYNLDPARLLEAFKEKKKIKTVLAVHQFGAMAEMPAILKMAAEFGACVVEDAACAIGSSLQGRPAGAWGMAGCFSFHPRKTLTTGEGGMVVTSDSGANARVKALRNHGMSPTSARREFEGIGYNYRMTEMQAALGRGQVSRVESMVQRRQEQAAFYDELFAGTSVEAPRFLADSRHSYQTYAVLLPKTAAGHRDQIVETLYGAGVETNLGAFAIPFTTYFRNRYDLPESAFPVAADIFARCLALPLHKDLTAEEQRTVRDRVLTVLRERGLA